MGDERDVLDADAVQNPDEIASLLDLAVATLRMGRQTHAAQVRDDHGVVLHQRFGEWHPHVTGIAKTMQQDHGGA